MKEFSSLKQLIENQAGLSNDAYIYSSDAAMEEGCPAKGGLVVLEAEEEADLNGFDEDAGSFAENMKYLMEVETLKHIIIIQKERDPKSSIDDLVKAVEYYAKNKDSMDE